MIKSTKRISKSLIVLAAIAALGVIMVFKIYIPIFVAFTGLLFAVIFDAAISKLEKWFNLNRKIAFVIVVLGFVGLLVLFFYLILPSLGRELDQFVNQLPEMFDRVTSWLRKYEWSDYFLRNFESSDPAQIFNSGQANILTTITGFSSQVVAGIAYVIIMLFLGVYLAFNPEDYRQKALSLFSEKKNKAYIHILHESIRDLQSWLVGKFFSMLITGVLTYIGLIIFEVPAPLALAFLTGLLTFVPNIGAIAAGVVTALLALSQSPQTMLYVIVLLLAIQFVESYIITPIIEKKAVSLAPVITLTAQLFLGFLFGILGVFLAAPMLVVGKVWLHER